MRKIVILAGLLAGAALFATGTPAKAWVGCECVKLGAASVCVPGRRRMHGSGRRLPRAMRLRGAEKSDEAPQKENEGEEER